MANLKTEVILSMNGKAAIQVLEALRDKAKAVREEIDNLDKDAPDFKERKAGLESVYKTLQNYQTNIIKDTERLDHALKNLSTTSLQNLRKALGDGRRQLQKLSEDDLAQAEEVRKKMKLIGDEVRLLEGQYVKIAEGLKNVKNQSDQWLDKAIKQQRDLVGSLEKTDASYQKNYSILKQLEAEEDRRRGKMSKNDAMATVSNKYANASELRRAKATITEVRDKTDSHKVGEIEQYNKALQEIDRRLGSISGQFVDVQKGIGNVSNQSDQWLDKAIKQQRDLVGSLQKSDASYQQNLATLKQLEAEEDRRRGKMSEAEAHQTVTSPNASASDLRRAKATLTEARDNTPTKYSDSIGDYNRELQEIDKRLEAVSGKAQQATMSWKQMKRVLSEPNKASGEDIKRTMEVIAQKIQQLPAGGKYVATLRRQYAMLEQTLKGTRLSQSALNDILARSKQGKASLDELRRAYKQFEEELNQINTKSKEFANRQKSMKELKKNIDEATGAVNKHGGAWQTAMKNLVAYVGLFGAFNMLKQKLTDAINLNLKYSDSLSDIRKITNYSMGTVNELSRMLAKIDSRTSLEGLTQLAYVGSRMGMGKYGAEGLYEFAKASDRVNVALHEDLGDDAMLTLSKFVETMGEVEKHGGNISTAFDSVASSIFKLAASSTSNGGSILEFAKRLTGLAKVTKVTSAQLLGLASASDSLMLMPEVASTAFGKLLSSLWTNYHSIEKMLGMQRDSLKGMIEEGRTMDALVTVLKNVSDKNLNSMDEYFKEFGSDGQRLKQVVVTMAQNVNVLEQHLDTSNEAYREGTAVVKEYQIQQQTAQTIFERANSMFEKAFVNPEGIDSVKEMAKMWYNFSKSLTHSQPFLLSVRFLFFELIVAVRMLLSVLPGLVAYLGTRGLIAVFSKLIPLFTGLKFATMASNIKLATKSVMGDARAVRILTLRWQALNAAMKANVIGLVLGVVTSLGFGIYELFSNTEKATGSLKRFDGSLEGVKSQANQAVGELDAYYHAVRDAQKGTNQRTAAIKQFNEKFGSYLSNLITEKSTAKDLAKAYREATDAIRAKIYLQMKEKDIQEQYTPRVGWSLDRLNEYGKVGKGTDSMDWLKAYEADSRDKGMRSIAKELAKRFNTTNTAEVLKSYFRGDETLRFDYRKNLDKYGNTTLDLTRAGEGDEKLFRALRYIAQTRSANSAMSNIDKKFGPVQKEIDDFLTKDDGKNILVDNDDDKKKGKGDKNPLPKEKNIAKDRANALIANIKAFYEEQMRKYLEWVAQMNADGEKISEGQQKEQMDYLQSQMDRALGSARQSIATLDDGWKEVYSHMNEDVMVFDDETSKQLLESIGKADIGELHKLFTKLSGDLSRENNKTLAENLGALLDQLFANGSKKLREAAEKLLARQREIQKILDEHDYTGAVNRKTRSDFDRLGFLRPADGVNADTPEGLEKMNTAFDKLTTKARESITVLYSLNPESEEFQNQFLQFLSVANEGFDFSKLSAQNLKALYLELIKYNNEYESASKKGDDERKELNDYGWSKTDYYKEYQKALPGAEQEVAIKGSYRNAGQRMGMESVSASDPELELLKARMTFAQEYYKFLEEHNATEQQLADARKGIMAEQANYTKKLTGDMFEQYNSLLTFMGPLQTFGESVGDAFATMTENAAEGRKQLKSALKQMIKSFATSSLQMISQQQIDRAQTTAHYEQLLLMQQVFAQAKLQAEVANGTAMIGAKQAANLTEEQLEGIHQQVMAALRSAGIFGWCVSTLGPIAGPIAYGAMMATLMGLLSFAISKIGGRDKSTNNTAKANNIKVTSGMLTYDSGNVQGLRPFVSNDGSLYWATEDNKPHRGVSLLTQPTATTINGQPSLVAENGPEIVIGRETTRAMQMNNPQLLRALVNFDRNFSGRKAYDAGNLSEAVTADPTGASVQELIANSAMANMALQEAVTTLLKRLDAPIEAKINMYGYGQLYDSMKKAERFMRNK